ncbi:MAG: TlpA family protein disulfide reductase [Calditrichaeota bacterium]|nr:TlpA family protein disulfide reductase [Calditrichota bacterium]MCB9369637.1 TlpA family protein disulfide reductase [Calditrichota bacterium]
MKSTILALFLASSTALYAADAAPFKIFTKKGDVTLEQLAGKVVYLDFWASWCEPCKKSFPWMNDLHAQFADSGLVVIAVNLDRDAEKADKFLEKIPANFQIGFDPEGTLAKTYEVKGMPSSYIIDRHGQLVASHIGFREKDRGDIQTEIETALHSK